MNISKKVVNALLSNELVAMFKNETTGTISPIRDQIDLAIINKHESNGEKIVRNVQMNPKIVVAKNGKKVVIITIENVEYEMYADLSFCKR